MMSNSYLFFLHLVALMISNLYEISATQHEHTNIFMSKENDIMDPLQTIELNGNTYDLTGLQEINLFTKNAEYIFDHESRNLSTLDSCSKMYFKNLGDQVMIVSFCDIELKGEKSSEVEISVVEKSRGNVIGSFSSENNTTKILPRIMDDKEYRDINQKIVPSEEYEPNDQNDYLKFFRNSLRGANTIANIFLEEGGTEEFDDSPCEDYKEIELAIAFDSTFCQEHGGERKAVSNIIHIMTLVSLRYEQNGLCTKVRLSHLEGYCGETDPFVEGVAIGKGGCSDDEYGLKQYFADYFMENRKRVHRNVAILITGSPLECREDGRCVVGCASKRSLCDPRRAYGVVDATINGIAPNDTNLRAVTISHELGHIIGADHIDEENKNFIMNALLNDGKDGFGRESISSMQCHMRRSSCMWI